MQEMFGLIASYMLICSLPQSIQILIHVLMAGAPGIARASCEGIRAGFQLWGRHAARPSLWRGATGRRFSSDDNDGGPSARRGASGTTGCASRLSLWRGWRDHVCCWRRSASASGVGGAPDDIGAPDDNGASDGGAPDGSGALDGALGDGSTFASAIASPATTAASASRRLRGAALSLARVCIAAADSHAPSLWRGAAIGDDPGEPWRVGGASAEALHHARRPHSRQGGAAECPCIGPARPHAALYADGGS